VRRVATVLVLGALFWGSISAGALAEFGYTDTGRDPDDTSGAAVADVSGTRRTVWQDPNGRRQFRVKVRAYEPLGPSWGGFQVSLDARGGPRKDARISLVNIEGPPYCSLSLPDGGWTFSARQVDRTISCRFRLRRLNPTKRIRWFVRSPTPGTIDPPDVDRAPDSGWYV
jgi:hypothetical protein